ncbi:MAG: Ig-like domain-containing protein [Lachnospiraceae bacterium]|nr:Ig-like domain-containing protein [Lachnospiraceae bacterium]
MRKNEKLLRKVFAGLVAAACVATAVPASVFASETVDVYEDEAVISESEAEVTENASAEDEFADEVIVEEEVSEPDKEENPDLTKAKEIKLNKEVTGITSMESFAIYKFKPDTTGRYAINGSYTVQGYPELKGEFLLRLFDGDKYVTSRTDGCYYHDNRSSYNLENEPYDLIKDTWYYLVAEPRREGPPIDFNFTVSLMYEVTLSTKEDPVDVAFNKEYVGHCCPDGFMNTDHGKLGYIQHYYKFSLKEPGTFTFHIEDDSTRPTYPYKTNTVYTICNNIDDILSSTGTNMSWQYHTHDKESYATTTHNTWLNTGDDSDEARISLLAGEYYLVIWGNIGTGYDKALNYKFKLKDYKALQKKGSETLLIDTRVNGSNDNVNFKATGYGEYYEKEAMPVVETNKYYRGILTEDSRIDYYHFTLPKKGPLYMTLESDDCIGKCFVTLRYWSNNPRFYSESGTDVIMQSDEYCATPDKPLNSTQLLNSYYEDPSIVYKKLKPEFMAGEYVIGILTQKVTDESNKINLGESGQYRFMISTGKNTDKPVKSLKLDPTVIPMSVSEKATLKAYVNSEATDPTVDFKVEPEGIAKVTKITDTPVKGVTEFEVEALTKGQAKITVTTNGVNSKQKALTAECVVSVIDSKACGYLAEKQKVDLKTADYFNDSTIGKNDKFEVTPKGVGSVSNGFFTAKKECENVTVTWYRKDEKVYVPQGKITLIIEKPKYFKDGKKDIKNKDVVRKGDEVTPSQMINSEGLHIIPNYYDCNAKEGFVEFDHTTGLLKVLKSGNFKVTAYYGYDASAGKNAAKNAGKIEYTVKAKLPTVKDAKIKPNASGKDKIVTITVSNVPKDIKLTADAWKAVKVGEDGKPTSEKADFEPSPVAVKESYTKCTVAIPAGTPAQKFAVVVTVDGADYPAIVTVN